MKKQDHEFYRTMRHFLIDLINSTWEFVYFFPCEIVERYGVEYRWLLNTVKEITGLTIRELRHEQMINYIGLHYDAFSIKEFAKTFRVQPTRIRTILRELTGVNLPLGGDRWNFWWSVNHQYQLNKWMETNIPEKYKIKMRFAKDGNEI